MTPLHSWAMTWNYSLPSFPAPSFASLSSFPALFQLPVALLPRFGCLEEETTSPPTGLKAQTPQGPSSEH